MLKQIKYYLCFIFLMTILSTVGRAQTLLASFGFENSNLTVDAGAIGSPVMTASGTPYYYGGDVTTVASACFQNNSNGSYFELTMSTAGYSTITVDFNDRVSSTGAGSGWTVTANDGSGYGGVLSNTAMGSAVWDVNPTITLGSTFNNNASIKIRWTWSGAGSATVRLDDIKINGTVSGPNVALASANLAVAPGNMALSSTKNIVYAFNLTVTNGPTTFNTVVFTSAGTYVAADLSKFQLWSNSSNTITGASQVSTNITTTLGTGAHTFSSISQSLSNGTTYYFITCDITGAATGCDNMTVSALTTANLTFSSGTKSGTAYAGDVQTIPGSAPGTQSTTITFPSDLQTTQSLSWTNGSGSGRIVVVSTSAIVATPTNGTNYTANTVFGSGATIAAGVYVVYSGAGNTVTVTGLTAGTKYYYEVFDYNCGYLFNTTTATGNPANCTTTTTPAAACASVSTHPAAGEYISQVLLPGDQGTNFTTGVTAQAAYMDYTATQSVTVTAGFTYTLTVTNGYATSPTHDACNVWIDYNNDGSFNTSAPEQVKYTAPFAIGAGTGGPYTIVFTVPAGTTPGDKRMRVVVLDNTPGACVCYVQDNSAGCNNMSYGEAEDYNIHVVAGCTLPSTPGAITGTAGVCQSSAPAGVAYSVAAVANATSYSWTYSGTGLTITAGATTNSITASFSAVATSGNLIVHGINACAAGPNSPAFAITVSPPPTASNAGPNQFLCANPATMAANAPGVGTGAWSVVNGTGTITTPASATSTITAIPASSFVTLRWTTTNGACTNYSDCVVHLQ